MDAADRAQVEIERADERRMQRRASDVKPAVSAMHCIDCCEPISEARRVACPGCRRCADCARDYERQVSR